jgi:hypothetical protein
MSDISLNPDEILVGTARGPGLYIANDLTTVAPADTVAPWASGWVGLGYASENGPTISGSKDSEDIKSWQSLGVLRHIITGRTVTVQFELMQWSALNLSLYWDIDTPTVTSTGAFSFDVRPDQANTTRQLGIDVQDGDASIRYVFPRVQLSAVGDQQFQRSAATLLNITFSALETQGSLLKVIGLIPPSIAPTSAPLSVGEGVAA